MNHLLGSLLLLFLLLPGLVSCDDSHAGVAGRTSPRQDPADPETAFWWTHVGQQSAAVANFGPMDTVGEARAWSLVVHLPGSGEVLSCVQGQLDLRQAFPIGTRGESFAIDIRPADGRVWAEVQSDADLQTEVTGIH